MNNKEENKLDAFADFEQLPPLENEMPLANEIPRGPTGDPIADASISQEAHLTEVALNLAWSALSGNISPILTMPEPDRQTLVGFLSTRCSSSGNEEQSGISLEEESITPSAEAAGKVVQTPEEKQKEQDFLDTLGI